MRFAFIAAQSNCTWAELAALWDTADQLDVFTTGWVYDHFYPLRTGPEEPTLEGWSCLAMLLARTKRLRGGVLVTGAPYRHPAVLANMAVTVDIASGGRLELGIGAGWFEAECEAYGIELGSMTERFDRLDEALTVIHSLLTRPDNGLRRPLLPSPGCAVRAEGRCSNPTRRSCSVARASDGSSRSSPDLPTTGTTPAKIRQSSPGCATASPSSATSKAAGSVT